ncbi:diacylglycerol kinase [Candidatus Williamhamiltonella defendens]|uniref:diacylglycerol kinase n=1 Tax=Candidatus Williamhamiltonella defendens TaxID=138072 RepID=UPI00165165BE
MKIVYKNEVACRKEYYILFLSILITFFINVSKVKKILMIGSIVFILSIEIINTVIENVVDCIETEKIYYLVSRNISLRLQFLFLYYLHVLFGLLFFLIL